MASNKECSKSVNEALEACYIKFYKDVFGSIYDFKTPEMRCKVNESLKKLRELKRSERETDSVSPDHMDYTLEESRCAYFYQYSVLHSKMVSFHFKEFLEENRLIQKKISEMKKLRILCLGGGAAIDAVAIVKLISDILLRKPPKAKEPLNLEVIVVDKRSTWRMDSLKILKAIKEHPSLNLTTEMNIDIEFIEGNVLQSFNEDLEKKIQKAHFVIMVKFAKDVKLMFPETSSAMMKKIIENIADTMRAQSCFFIVDNGGGGTSTDVRSAFRKNSHWKNIYESTNHMTHALESDTVQKLAELLPGCFCSRETRVFSYTWYKTEPEYTKIKLKGNYSKEKFKK